MVHSSPKPPDNRAYNAARPLQPNTTKQTIQHTPTCNKNESNYWNIIRRKYLSVGYNPDTADILLDSWHTGAKSCYAVYLKA